jgi:glucose/arabinose dehydrogenase
MEFAPDGRLFVLEKGGAVRVVRNGALLSAPFVTVPALSDNEHGLLGIAFDPNFNANRYVYLYYTRPTSPPTNGVSRFTANGDTAVPGSELSILSQDYSGGSVHNGGAIHFGLDGKLYVAVGASNPNDSQDLGRHMGKILRINTDGTVPPDNPFVSTPGARPEIWAYGFRNPYTFAVDSATGVIYVNDVGEANWEEIDLLTKGGNYGWPVCEGPRNTGVGSCSSSSLSYPVYAYPHNGSSMSITGGAFYRATQFPSTYRGSYFFGDYAAGFIKGLNANNALFDFSNLSSPGAAPGTVDLKVGPDGALYYASIYTGTIVRISYYGAASNSPPVAAISANPTAGQSPLTVTFSGSATDADGDALSYSWSFGDGVTDAGATVTHTYYSVGQYTAALTVDDGQGGSDAKTTLIVVGSAPTPQIVTPSAGLTYQGGDTIAYSGVATDLKDGDLPDSAFSWTIVFHHDTHTHPFLGPIVGTKAGSFQIPSSGEVSANTWYRIHLVVTDSDGLKSEATRDVVPVTASFTLNTNVPGLVVTLDGQPFPTPFTTRGVVNFARAISAPSPQTVNGDTYVFSSWSDGGAATHTIRIPRQSTNYVATYVPASALPGGNDPDLAAAYSFDQGSGSTLSDDSGNGRTGAITNGAWSAGKYGQALSLDGTAFANIGDFSSVAVPYTIEFWFSMSSLPTGGFYKLFGQGGCCALMPSILLGDRLLLQTGPTRFVYGSTTFTAASLNQWHHAAFVIDSLSSLANWKVYIDGANVTGRMGFDIGPSSAFGNATTIGGNDLYTSFKNFKGLIDELRIYRTARSQAQIQADMVTPIK